MTSRACHRVALLVTVVLLVFALPAAAAPQWDPFNGQWGKDDPGHIRVMTWNVKDALRTTNAKQEGMNSWTGLSVIVAAMRPDVLMLQETGDTGNGVDSVVELETVADLLFHGGNDPYNGNAPVTAYVQKYAPGYDLPHVFVSTKSDGYNRNMILSRFPFADLNGDTKSELSDIPYLLADEYAPGGNGGVRGFQFAEIDLPDGDYSGDLVVGNAHLKAYSDPQSQQERLDAAKNVAYFIDYWYNGAGTGVPDPHDKIFDNPKATKILDGKTSLVIGGDWNEDESTNGRDGPALWLVRAELDQSQGMDGTDRDASDAVYDASAHPITGKTNTYSGSSSKLDYLAWHDCIALLNRSFVFHTGSLSTGQMPPEILYFPSYPAMASSFTSDHSAVIGDFEVPREDLPLSADAHSLSAQAGGAVQFALNAGAANAGRSYFTLGSVTGTTPGFALPGGTTLPLNWDPFTALVFKLANTPALEDFHGVLDAAGAASARLDTFGPLPPEAVGLTLYFAYTLYAPYGYVSNPLGIDVLP